MKLSPDETRRLIRGHMKMMVDYWSRAPISQREIDEDGGEAAARLSGFAHSLLAMIDGCSSGIPAIDLVVDGKVVNDGVSLHDEWY